MGLVLIEVKHRAQNDHKPANYNHWGKYRSDMAFSDWDGMRATGMYELARNWRIGVDLAHGRRLVLANLGPDCLFSGGRSTQLANFEQCLCLSEHQSFLRLTWSKLRCELGDQPQWLMQYLDSRLGTTNTP
jgi:hypothetical protein